MHVPAPYRLIFCVALALLGGACDTAAEPATAAVTGAALEDVSAGDRDRADVVVTPDVTA